MVTNTNWLKSLSYAIGITSGGLLVWIEGGIAGWIDEVNIRRFSAKMLQNTMKWEGKNRIRKLSRSRLAWWKWPNTRCTWIKSSSDNSKKNQFLSVNHSHWMGTVKNMREMNLIEHTHTHSLTKSSDCRKKLNLMFGGFEQKNRLYYGGKKNRKRGCVCVRDKEAPRPHIVNTWTFPIFFPLLLLPSLPLFGGWLLFGVMGKIIDFLIHPLYIPKVLYSTFLFSQSLLCKATQEKS